MTSEQIKELRALEAATPGAWANRALIAAARNALPELLAELEQLRAIVRCIAHNSPFYDHNDCAYCGAQGGGDPHDGDCIYRRARELVARY